jgi:hypothetical protein
MIDSEDLAMRAAGYIAGNLIGRQLLVATDREGYELALALAAAAGPGPTRAIREQLRPLVEHSIDVGQEPPEGWQSESADGPRKFQVGDEVRVRPTPPDGIDHGDVVGTLTRAAYLQHRDHWGEVEGTGPLYIVNVGNVHASEYEEVYAESNLTAP